MQSIWKGSISFGLVSIRVQLYVATEERGIAFHQVHAADGGRIRYRRVCSVDGEDVGFAEIAKGYELANGDLVMLSDEDFAALPLPSGRAINVLSFVEADTIDPIRLSRCYYCEPVGNDSKPYRLLCEALERTGKVAMVKVALRGRESVALLRPHERMLLLQLLLWPDEVRPPRFPFLDDDAPLSPQELRMVESYIDTLTGAVDQEELVDRYRVALEQLVEAKVGGRGAMLPPGPAEVADTTVDLMEALRRSVAQAKRRRESATDGAPARGTAGNGKAAAADGGAGTNGRAATTSKAGAASGKAGGTSSKAGAAAQKTARRAVTQKAMTTQKAVSRTSVPPKAATAQKAVTTQKAAVQKAAARKAPTKKATPGNVAKPPGR